MTHIINDAYYSYFAFVAILTNSHNMHAHYDVYF